MRCATFLGLLVACSPGPRPPQPEAVAPPQVGETSATRTAGCQDARCWLARADEAQKSGIVDVAAAHLGRAFAVDSDPQSLTRWIDGLLASGQARRAREVLAKLRVETNDPAIVAAITAAGARVPAEAPARPLAPEPASPAIVRAFTAAVAGRITEAVDGFTAALVDAGPDRLAAAADAIGPTSDPAAQAWARRTQARARVQFHEHGFLLKMVPIEAWMVRDVTWREGQRITLRNVEVLDVPGDRLGLLEISTQQRPPRRLFFPVAVETMVATADGVLRSDGPRLVEQQLPTGDLRVVADPGARIDLLASVGAGEQLLTLIAEPGGARLFDARGQLLGVCPLDGTTPTITRVYTGEGTHHDNILRDEASWPVALALSDDAKIIAVGASDSHVHVFDRTRAGKKTVLKFKWHYQERRPLGGNPDLNLPLALRLDPDGAQLLAVYAHGDVIRWDTRTGKPLRHVPATCSESELTAVVNRYAPAASPRRPATADDRSRCGRATVAAISGDGGLIATAGISGVRVRDASGVGVALMLESELPDDRLTFLPDHTLVMSDLHGAVATWRRGAAVTRTIAPSPSGPLSPILASNGRVFHFHFVRERRTAAWDLVARAPIGLPVAAKEEILAIAPDGERVAVRAAGAVEIRELPAGQAPIRLPLPADATPTVRFSAGGHVLVDMQNAARSLTLIAPDGVPTPLAIATSAYELALSDDGRWLAGAGHGAPMQVWSTRTGALQHTLDPGVRHMTFARDGSFVAWLAQPQQGEPRVQVKLQQIGAPTPGPMLALDGWPQHIAASPDGAELLVLLHNGDLVRWRHGAGTHTRHHEDALIGVNHIAFADDGRTLLLAGYGDVQIRANDTSLTPLATVYSLLSGGWMAVSRDGAIDGSADAVDHLATRLTRGADTLLYTGALGWDAVHVEGVVGRALAGQQTAPPVQ